MLAEATQDEADKKTLESYADEEYSAQVSAKRISVLDLLEAFPSIDLPLEVFLSILPPMRVRQ